MAETTQENRSEAKHTPGPWRVEKSNVIGQLDEHFGVVLHLIVPDRPGHDAGVSLLTYSNHAPNARLIASAPTMRSTLDETAGSLAEILSAVEIVRERLAAEEVTAAEVEALDHIREALVSLRVNVEAA